VRDGEDATRAGERTSEAWQRTVASSLVGALLWLRLALPDAVLTITGCLTVSVVVLGRVSRSHSHRQVRVAAGLSALVGVTAPLLICGVALGELCVVWAS
jgi:hypothetical protein